MSREVVYEVIGTDARLAHFPCERFKGWSCAIMICVVLFPCIATWAAPAGSNEALTLSSNELRRSSPLGAPILPPVIRMRWGDDPGWKEPDFNDGDWDKVREFCYPAGASSPGASAACVWFRFHMRFAADIIDTPLVAQTYHYEENVQIFLNGRAVGRVQDTDPTTGITPRCIVPGQSDCVVALRWSPSRDRLLEGVRSSRRIGFLLYLDAYEHMLAARDQRDKRDRALAGHRILLMASFVIFFLFHFTLYTHYRLRRESVYYGMTALFCALALGSLHVSEVYRYDQAIWGLSYLHCFLAFMPLSVVSGFGLIQLVLGGDTRKTLPLYASIGAIAYVATTWTGNILVHWFPLLVVPELAWLVWCKYRKSGLPLGWSVVSAVVVAGVLLSAVGSVYNLSSESGFILYAAWYLLLAFLLVVAVAFIREYARDKKRIEAFATSLEHEVAARTVELHEEIGVRRKAEEELKTYQDSLEELVRQRTEELEARSTRLAEEMAEHRRTEEALQVVSRRLADVRDEERRHMARELHDSVAQELAGIVMNVGLIEDALPRKKPEVKRLLDTTLALGEKCSQEVRTLSYLLHPPLLDQLGLVPALRSYVDGFAKRSGIRITVDVGSDFGRIPGEIELAVFRIAQECLGNIHRHAHSRTAHISLDHNADNVVLEVRDAGIGIDSNTLEAILQRLTGGGVGIAGMQERLRLLNGTFSMESGVRGTRVRATIPVGGNGH